MILIDRKTKQILASSEIRPEALKAAQEQVLLAHIQLHPELLKNQEG